MFRKKKNTKKNCCSRTALCLELLVLDSQIRPIKSYPCVKLAQERRVNLQSKIHVGVHVVLSYMYLTITIATNKRLSNTTCAKPMIKIYLDNWYNKTPDFVCTSNIMIHYIQMWGIGTSVKMVYNYLCWNRHTYSEIWMR